MKRIFSGFLFFCAILGMAGLPAGFCSDYTMKSGLINRKTEALKAGQASSAQPFQAESPSVQVQDGGGLYGKWPAILASIGLALIILMAAAIAVLLRLYSNEKARRAQKMAGHFSDTSDADSRSALASGRKDGAPGTLNPISPKDGDTEKKPASNAISVMDAKFSAGVDKIATEIENLKYRINSLEDHGKDGKTEALKLVAGQKAAILKAQAVFFKTRANGVFKKNNVLLLMARDRKNEHESGFYLEIIRELPPLVADAPTLANCLSNALKTLEDYFLHQAMLCEILEEAEKDSYPVKANWDYYFRINDYMQYLNALTFSGRITELSAFSPEKWIKEYFIQAADLIIREYQKVSTEGTNSQIRRAYELSEKLLSKAGIIILHVVLNQTVYDARIHIVRSTSNRPELPDGVITDVVRNGFSYTNGPVIQQSEVIVNRARA